MREIVIDSFAGGGGASEGIRAALGYDPDIAVNHDRMALAMHRINHPGTRHIEEDVITVDAVSMCGGRPIGMLWMSPDCKHHSKAKGGRPRDKNIRGLAWTIVGWVHRLPKWQRPRVVFLENVEEFADWGPLTEDGQPCSARKGQIFREFVRAWEAMGYRVEWRELRASDFGIRTIRKRLYLIARRDGLPIVWSAPTHGDPESEAVRNGLLQPYRWVADIIDWSLPCPSIFETSEQIRQRFGIRANRPLAPATMARIAKGVMRYVVTAAKPFLVQVNHGGSTGGRAHGVEEPAPTLTGGRGEAVITPFVSYAQHGGAIRPADAPLHTVTASRKDQDAVVAPVVVGVAHGDSGGRREYRADAPIGTITRSHQHGVAAVHLQRQFGASIGSAADEPVGTITAGGAGKAAVVAAFLAQHNTGLIGRSVEEPVSTIVGKGCTQGLVAAHMLNLRGSDRRDSGVDEPMPTVSAQGNHAAAVYAFLAKYYGAGLPSQGVDEPIHTVTTKPRHGLVTVSVAGEPYVIVDIGMRMLTPRERFAAQGFRPDYIIDRGILDDGTEVSFTLEEQGRFCGNSVCPGMAEMLVRANFAPRDVAVPVPALTPLFEVA